MSAREEGKVNFNGLISEEGLSDMFFFLCRRCCNIVTVLSSFIILVFILVQHNNIGGFQMCSSFSVHGIEQFLLGLNDMGK